MREIKHLSYFCKLHMVYFCNFENSAAYFWNRKQTGKVIEDVIHIVFIKVIFTSNDLIFQPLSI